MLLNTALTGMKAITGQSQIRMSFSTTLFWSQIVRTLHPAPNLLYVNDVLLDIKMLDLTNSTFGA